MRKIHHRGVMYSISLAKTTSKKSFLISLNSLSNLMVTTTAWDVMLLLNNKKLLQNLFCDNLCCF